MYARSVSMLVKVGGIEALTALIEAEIVPMLRGLEGFQDALTMIVPGGREAIGISIWSLRADADRYSRGTDKEVRRRLAGLLDDLGTAKTFQLSNSTFHELGTRVSP